jgi:hypothetical protein
MHPEGLRWASKFTYISATHRKIALHGEESVVNDAALTS